MDNLVVASEAISAHRLTRKRLNRDYERLYRNIYLPKGFEPTAWDRVYGAWLATGRTATMVGLSAAVLHGSKWIDDDIVPEILTGHARAPIGIRGYKGAVPGDELCRRRGILCTTPRVRPSQPPRPHRGPGREGIARGRLATVIRWGTS